MAVQGSGMSALESSVERTPVKGGTRRARRSHLFVGEAA